MKKHTISSSIDVNLLTHDIADRIQLGIYIYRLQNHDDDHSLVLVYANKASEAHTGMPADMVIGKMIDQNFPHLRMKGIPRKFADVVRTQEETDVEELCYDDGHAEPTWFSIKAFPLKQNCVGVSFKNITDRKNAERKLEASNARYQNLYENTPIMLHSINSKGLIVAVSNCWLSSLGYTRDEVIGYPLTHFLTEESTLFAKIIAYPYFIEHGYVQDISYQVIKKSGELMDVTLSAIAEKDENGNFLRSLAVMIDVTARKKAEAAQEKLIGELRKALDEITSLRGILPLCSFCKRVRNDKGYWEQVDIYIAKHSPAEISHSICPECMAKHYPTLGQKSKKPDQST
ncbi:MAG: PAS domain-containing protein [Syntrophaceae bacterium]|nr:PAS domain-containing protein [Syntrophaceae bacterium]